MLLPLLPPPTVLPVVVVARAGHAAGATFNLHAASAATAVAAVCGPSRPAVAAASAQGAARCWDGDGQGAALLLLMLLLLGRALATATQAEALPHILPSWLPTQVRLLLRRRPPAAPAALPTQVPLLPAVASAARRGLEAHRPEAVAALAPCHQHPTHPTRSRRCRTAVAETMAEARVAETMAETGVLYLRLLVLLLVYLRSVRRLVACTPLRAPARMAWLLLRAGVRTQKRRSGRGVRTQKRARLPLRSLLYLRLLVLLLVRSSLPLRSLLYLRLLLLFLAVCRPFGKGTHACAPRTACLRGRDKHRSSSHRVRRCPAASQDRCGSRKGTER